MTSSTDAFAEASMIDIFVKHKPKTLVLHTAHFVFREYENSMHVKYRSSLDILSEYI